MAYNDYGNDVNIVYFDTYINRGCDWFVNDLNVIFIGGSTGNSTPYISIHGADGAI